MIEVAPPAVEEPGGHYRRHWIIVHEPGRIPELKGWFSFARVETFLRELIACRPADTRYTVCSLTWDFQLDVESGNERISIADHFAAVERLDELRKEARQRWGRSSPFRLGLLVGKEGIAAPNPYLSNRTMRAFEDGVVQGRAMRWHA